MSGLFFFGFLPHRKHTELKTRNEERRSFRDPWPLFIPGLYSLFCVPDLASCSSAVILGPHLSAVPESSTLLFACVFAYCLPLSFLTLPSRGYDWSSSRPDVWHAKCNPDWRDQRTSYFARGLHLPIGHATPSVNSSSNNREEWCKSLFLPRTSPPSLLPTCEQESGVGHWILTSLPRKRYTSAFDSQQTS